MDDNIRESSLNRSIVPSESFARHVQEGASVTLIDPRTGNEWVPDFEGQRPPFQPGNKLALKHGAFTPAKIDPVADQLLEGILADPDLVMLRMPAFRVALVSYCTTAARVRYLEAWVDDLGVEDAADSDRGKTPPLEILRKWTATMDNKAARLGLDPVSFAKLHKTVASTKVDLARLLSQSGDADVTVDEDPHPPFDGQGTPRHTCSPTRVIS